MPGSSSFGPAPKMGSGRLRGVAVKPKDMRGTLLRMWTLTKGYRKGLGWIFVCSGLASGSAVLSPLVIGKIINCIDMGSGAGLLLLLLAAIYGGDWLVRFLQNYMMAGVGQRIVCHIRKILFDVMRTLPLAYFDRSTHGDLMSRLTNDVDNISTTISDSLTQLMMLGFTIAGVLCTMIYLNPFLTMLSGISVFLVFLLTRIITGRTRKLYKEQQAILGRLNGEIEEGISGLTVVKSFNREDAMYERFEEQNRELCRVATRALIWSGYLMPVTNVINNLGFLMVVTASGLMAARGMITVGLISSFALYSRQLTRPFTHIANIYNTFQTAVAGAERIFEVFDEEPEPEDIPGAAEAARPRENALASGSWGSVEFSHVQFGYDADRPVLRDVSFHIPAGTRAAIVGATGAGKTTIISLLTRFYDVDSGHILLDGRDLREYSRHSLRRIFGVVLQDTALFGTSVRENIRYGHRDASDSQVEEAAKMAGAHGFITRLPHGYDTVLEQGGESLSQGERQLLTIARAILADAPILILDEATSSVDTVTEQKIRGAMLRMTEGRTSFIIAHRLSTIRDSDIIILLEQGKVAEMGSHEELLALGGRYAGMYKAQMGGNVSGAANHIR